MHCLEDYKEIVGVKVIGEIHKKASKLYGKHVLHINSTYQGGGVAEILNSLVPLMNDVGLDAGWRILHGNPDFFSITKKFHNALQGEPIHFTALKERLYMQANEDFSSFTHIDHDCVIVHDPQPLPLIKYYKKRQPWIWRCHVDLSNPNDQIWQYLTTFILRYDTLILSNERYKKDDLPVDQRIIYPAIDPLTLKNVDISDKAALQYLKKFGVEMDKPIIIQISRYDMVIGECDLSCRCFMMLLTSVSLTSYSEPVLARCPSATYSAIIIEASDDMKSLNELPHLSEI